MSNTLLQDSNRKGFFVSALIHAVLFLGLFFVLLDNPPKEDVLDGIILDFGDSPEGSGGNTDSYGGSSGTQESAITPSDAVAEASSKPVATPTSYTPSSNKITAVDAEAIAIEKQKKVAAYQQKQALLTQKKLEEEQKKKQQEEQAYKNAVANAFNKGKTGSGNGSGTGTGNNTGSGSGIGGNGNNGGSGLGDGNGGGGNGGSGGGTGTDYSLSGRSLLSKKVPFNNSQKAGKIVVQIKVDQQGNVIFAKGGYKGSTSADSYLIKISEEAAYKFKFSANSDVAEEQFGTISFNYTFN